MIFSGQVNSVQILRGIAAMLVIASHIGFKLVQMDHFDENLFSFGEYGVGIFFVISGFIMMLVTNKKRKKSEFIVDRIIRIIPAYWFVTIIALVAYITVPNMVNSSGGHTGLIQSFTLVKIPYDVKFLVQNGWTLSFEFLFYLTLLFFINTTNEKKILLVFCIFSILSLIYYLYPNRAFMLFYSTVKYEFVIGMSIFIFFENSVKSKIFSIFFITISLLIIGINKDISIDVSAKSALFVSLFVFFFISIEKFINDRNIIIKSLLYIGNISYSLYLIHPFTLQASKVLATKIPILNATIPYLIISITSSIIVSHIVYVAIEKNVSKKIKIYLRKK